MKKNTKSTLATTALFASLGFAANAFGVVYFQADFNDSTAIDADTGVVANADIANLNAGTQAGSWAFPGADTTSARGAIVSNPSNTDNAFAFDSVLGDNRTAKGVFTQTVDIAGGNALRFEFDIFATRQGNPGSSRETRISLNGSTSSDGDQRAYVLIFDQGVGAAKEFRWLDAGNTPVTIASEEGIGFLNADVDNYQTWDWADGNSTRVRIDVLGQETVAGAAGDGGALVSIDWNGNGIWDTLDSPIGARTGEVTTLDSFDLFYGGNQAKGGFIDNISAIPEPSTALMGALGVLALLRRRR